MTRIPGPSTGSHIAVTTSSSTVLSGNDAGPVWRERSPSRQVVYHDFPGCDVDSLIRYPRLSYGKLIDGFGFVLRGFAEQFLISPSRFVVSCNPFSVISSRPPVAG